MPKTRLPSKEEAFEMTREDHKVYAALDDLIHAIQANGNKEGMGSHLASVIEARLFAHQHREIEEEGLNGEECA